MLSLNDQLNSLSKEGRLFKLEKLARSGTLRQICAELKEPNKTECIRFLCGYHKYGRPGIDRGFKLAPINGDVLLPKGVDIAELQKNELGQCVLDREVSVRPETAILLFDLFGKKLDKKTRQPELIREVLPEPVQRKSKK